jgi:hypothetical protein
MYVGATELDRYLSTLLNLVPLVNAVVKPNIKEVNACDNEAAPFQWAVVFRKEDISFFHGRRNLERHDPKFRNSN